jgi:hypothetical protein
MTKQISLTDLKDDTLIGSQNSDIIVISNTDSMDSSYPYINLDDIAVTGHTYNDLFTYNGSTNDTITLGNLDLFNNDFNCKGDAEFEGDVKIKGKSILEMFETIEKRLAILHVNPELENRWEELKSLGEKYRQLEQEILEKEKMWTILKK